MPLLYGDGKTPTHPAWVTGRETPTQRDKRFRDINDAIEAQNKRDEERKNRELFKRLERQGELRLQRSPPSPPKSPDVHTPFPEDVPFMTRTRLGTQDRFETHLDRRIEGYEATFGMTPLFGSQAYESAENMAREDWRGEQEHVPDDLVAEREVGLYLHSRELRAEAERPPPDVDSKWDILVDSVRADVAAEFVGGGISTPTGGFAVSESEALRYADDAVDEWLKDIEADIRKDIGKDADPQVVREQLYRALRVQEHLSDVLDEWGFPRDIWGDGEYIPSQAVDEALNREGAENEGFFKDFPDRPGLLEKITGLFNKKWIPVLDPMMGRGVVVGQPTKRGDASLDDVHRAGQQLFADPVAHIVLKGVGQAARAGELGFGELTGVETTTVSNALQSQLAEDVLSEAISPEFILVALPGAGIGVRGLTGAARLTRITANLTVGTDIGLARGFPLLRVSSAQAVFRGLTAVARSPLALRGLPQAVRNNPVFQRGLYNLRVIRAERVGRGLPHDEWLKAIGATDDAKLRRVLDDAYAGRLSSPEDLPLRLAIDNDLVARGRSAEDIIEAGLFPPPPSTPRRGQTFRAEAPMAEGELPERVGVLAETRGELARPELMSRRVVLDEIERLEGVLAAGGKGVRGAGRQGAIRKRIEYYKRLLKEPVPLGPARPAEEVFQAPELFDLREATRAAPVSDEVTEFWRTGESQGFLTQREAAVEQRLFDRLNQGKIISHEDLLRVVRSADLIDPDLVKYATDVELLEALQARRLEAALLGKKLPKLSKDELIALVDEAALPISKTASKNKILSELKTARDRLKEVKKTIEMRSFEYLTEGDVAALYRLRAEKAGDLPTQVFSEKHAARMENNKWTAFDPKASPEARRVAADRYVSEAERVAASYPEGSVGRVSGTADAKLFRWEWEAKFGDIPLGTVQGEVSENLRVLTAEHRGTAEERLAKLPMDRSKEIVDDVDDFLFQFRDRLDAGDLSKFKERLLNMMLDSEAGLEIFDAGRQLEALFKITNVSQRVKNGAYDALKVLTTRGATPSAKQITDMRLALDPVLGRGVTSQLLNARKLTTKGGELVLNTIGLPRALMASADLSAIVRQGSILGARQPVDWIKMAGRSIRAFWSPGYADALRESLLHRGVIRLQDGTAVDISDFTKRLGAFLGSDAGQKGLTYSEEVWMTRFASKWGWHLPRDAAGRLSINPTKWEKVPFPVPLAQGERSYVLGLDKMRADFIDNMIGKLVRRGMANGRPAELEHFQQLALFVNNASGRGKLPEFLRTYSPFINALLFAPRLVVSRFAILGDVARHTIRGGPMRRVVWETLAADAMTAGAGLYMLDLGLTEVGVDANVNFLQPLKKSKDGKWYTNSEFLKLKIGDTTFIDFGASMLPVQRLLLGLGTAAYQGDGEMAAELANRFRRTKLAPVPSGVEDVVTGTDFIGGKIEFSLDDLLGDVIASRVVPLSWQGPVEAIAASRGEIDIDIGPAILDLISDYKLKPDEAIVAGIALSAEMIGGGVVSYFRPGDKLREKDDEKLQEMVAGGEITETEGQEINDMDDLNTIQAGQVEAERGPEEKELEAKVLEQGLWRDSEWAKNKKDEEEFNKSIQLRGGYFHPETGKWEQLLKWPQAELDRMLRTHQIDGGDWGFRTGENTAAIINARNALFSHEEEDIEDIENPVDKLIAEYWDIEPIDFLLPGGEYDWEAFSVTREAKQAEVSKAVGDAKAVAEYFEGFRDETDTQKDARVAKEQRNTLLDETPMYMGGISDVTVNKLRDEIKDYLLSVGSSWGVARYIQWLYYQGEEWQTKEMAVTYWVALGERDQVINPVRTRMVLANEDLVLFYPGLFRGLTDEGKQSFVSRYGVGPLSKELKEDFIDTGEISMPGPGERMEPELFKPRPLFGD